MPWDIEPNIPVYIQLIEHLEYDIISGLYSPGDKIPSVRELAATASVNPNTVQRALLELERKGLIITQRTNGKYVTDDVTLLNESKEHHADMVIDDFLSRMNKLGYDTSESSNLLIKYIDNKNNEGVE